MVAARRFLEPYKEQFGPGAESAGLANVDKRSAQRLGRNRLACDEHSIEELLSMQNPTAAG